MPLSSYGLCDAEITIPASNPSVRARYAIAGVGTTPALTTVAPSAVRPRASSSLDPRARFTRVASDHKPVRLSPIRNLQVR